MSMQELPDDELDKLFRKSAEEFEPEFNPQAWSSMRKKLDDEDGKLGGIVWWKAGALVLLLLTIGIVGYYLWPETKLNSKEKALTNSSITIDKNPSEQVSVKSKIEGKSSKSAQDSPEIVQQSTAKEEANPDFSEKEIAKIPPSEQPPFKEPLMNKKTINTDSFNKNKIVKVRSAGKQPVSDRFTAKSKPVKKSGIENRDQTAVVLTNQNPAKAALNQKTRSGTANNLVKTNPKNHLSSQRTTSKITKNQGITKEIPTKSNSVAAIEPNSVESLANTNSTISLGENSRSTLVTLPKLTGHGWQFLKLSWPAPTVAYTPPPPPLAIPKKEDVSTFFRKGLSARVMAGPDLSFISTSEMIKNPSLLVSILLEYRFSKRLSLQTGAAGSAKLYNATGEQYQWPEAWNSQRARPVAIWGNCKVLDIPLNLRYDISQGSKSRWFVSSGISSYVMLNEKYDYTYHYTNNIKWPSWEGTTGSYWFGVMNLSMGFERRIGRRLSLQAEPYFKLPLAEVGLGKIKLNTSGIFISARYKLGHF